MERVLNDTESASDLVNLRFKMIDSERPRRTISLFMYYRNFYTSEMRISCDIRVLDNLSPRSTEEKLASHLRRLVLYKQHRIP